MEDLTCFVIIGFGKKPSHANGKLRILDLDETYSVLIKPVFESLGISCYRAIDKNLSGSIDKLMLQEIKNADIALVDISTLNANVMWELGVRHALKPHHTIMICEKEQMGSIPFDVGHFVIHQYAHSEEGIPYKEVERFRAHLTKIIDGVLNQTPRINDSPVFTFLQEELNNSLKMNAVSNIEASESNKMSFSELIESAEEAKNKKDFITALKLFSKSKEYALENMTLKDSLPYIISRQALCTYKSKNPNELEALVNAKIIMEELDPQQSQDTEVLGLTGAINKRLYELTDNISYLDAAINSYEKGFLLKQDYYNGINAAFMLYKKTELLKTQHKDWEDIKLKADYIRNNVLEIALKLELEPDFNEKQDAIWILLTIAEAYNYKANNEKMSTYENKAQDMAKAANDTFAMSSYQEQKQKIEAINVLQTR
ncbi:tetratricopeptide repeat-containing protein [Mariniflexile sp. AS56]|uniref:tetratricopeptide repeat-containing protein n=1 Tax=Mariniflexile sp. AS56 TaxID=3063957 RepID=UPI0026ECF34D|nr:tetratricopeptide repeat-containing protein [Mariniflexile sp. AS56]MDO7173834.1 TRAFs-binding domain-containing protein [Mariniflexile sp. AS56]